MSTWTRLDNLETYDNYSNRIIKVEPDLYINQFCHLRLFLRDDCFGHIIESLNITTVGSVISPSICSPNKALDDYVELVAEPVHILNDDAPEEFCYLIPEHYYYIKTSLFETLFKNNKVDILVE